MVAYCYELKFQFWTLVDVNKFQYFVQEQLHAEQYRQLVIISKASPPKAVRSIINSKNSWLVYRW